MGLNKKVAAGSEVLTHQIWNNQINDIGSEFNVGYNIKNGSVTFIYDSSDNLASGNDFSTTGSVYEWFEYDSSNNLISGHQLRDGKQVDFRYTYDSNGNLSNEFRSVS